MKNIVLLLLLSWSATVLAQAELKDASMRDLIEAEDKLEHVVEELTSEGAILDISTP